MLKKIIWGFICAAVVGTFCAACITKYHANLSLFGQIVTYPFALYGWLWMLFWTACNNIPILGYTVIAIILIAVWFN